MNYTEMLFNRDERLVNLLNQADSKNLELIEEINDREEEIERLNNIIKEVREYLKENSIYYPTSDGCQWVDQFKVLEILNKGE